MSDPILDELRRHREEIAARFDYDIGKMMADARARQFSWEHDVVSFVSGRKVVVYEAPKKKDSKSEGTQSSGD